MRRRGRGPHPPAPAWIRWLGLLLAVSAFGGGMALRWYTVERHSPEGRALMRFFSIDPSAGTPPPPTGRAHRGALDDP